MESDTRILPVLGTNIRKHLLWSMAGVDVESFAGVVIPGSPVFSAVEYHQRCAGGCEGSFSEDEFSEKRFVGRDQNI